MVMPREFNPRQRRPLVDRYWEKVVCGLEPDDCYDWLGGRHTFGYGRFIVPGDPPTNMSAHRFAWELANGPIPNGLWVLHSCDNPPCSNIRHLFLGTIQDNLADMRAKGRQRNERCPTCGAFSASRSD